MGPFSPRYILIFLALVASKVTGSPTESEEDIHDLDSNPLPPHFPSPSMSPPCMAFPGTPEWDKCFKTLDSQFGNLHHQLDQENQEMKAWENKFPGEGQIVTSEVNGIKFRSRGLPGTDFTIKKKEFHLKFKLESDLEVKVTHHGNTSSYDFMENGKIKHWISIRVPNSKHDQVHFSRDGDLFHIWGPAPEDKGTHSAAVSSSVVMKGPGINGVHSRSFSRSMSSSSSSNSKPSSFSRSMTSSFSRSMPSPFSDSMPSPFSRSMPSPFSDSMPSPFSNMPSPFSNSKSSPFSSSMASSFSRSMSSPFSPNW